MKISQKTLFLLSSLTAITLPALGAIKILCTSALIENQYETRKEEYIIALKKIKEQGFNPYVVESCAQGPTFLNDYAENVFYARTNDPKIRNKGVNEAVSIRACFKHFNFDDDDMIIKLTGRYYFLSDYFFNFIKNNPSIDIFVKEIDGSTQLFFGCFAMRYKYFKKMLEEFDYTELEEHMINIEKKFKNYVDQCASNSIPIATVGCLQLKVSSFGIGIQEISIY